MNCIIIGDKYQRGMKSKGCMALMKSSKKGTVLDNQYELLNNIFNNIDITYVYGFDAKKLLDAVQEKNYHIDMIYNESHDKYNEAFSIGLVNEKLNNNTLIVLGHQILTSRILKKLKDFNRSGVFVYSSDAKSKIGCVMLNHKITTLNFGLDNQIHDIYYLNKESSIALKKLIQTQKYNNYFLFELLNKLIDQGLEIRPILL